MVDRNMYNAFNSVTLGLDKFFDTLDIAATNTNFPPYNILKDGEHSFVIEMALAGYPKDDIKLTVENRVLTVSYDKTNPTEHACAVIHKGISTKAFKRYFTMSEHMVVKKASYNNGLLIIQLEEEIPEYKKPVNIKILDTLN